MSDLQDASTVNWRCHSCFKLFDNSVQATYTARKGSICPYCFNTEPLFSKAYVENALATQRADLIGGDCWLCEKRETISDVLAILEGEK
jgi:hypothetical protein